MSQRQKFTVELRPGETTIVSWKKLNRDFIRAQVPAPSTDGPPGAHPSLEAHMVPAMPNEGAGIVETKDAPPPNRFNAVIEKIERLYMGHQSSDEEDLADVPDEDEYDTEDSFIDDADLNEYFEVDKSATKHEGFFINRGKLERLEANSSPSKATKKRKGKDHNVLAKGGESLHKRVAKLRGIRMKAAARSASLAAPKSSGLQSSSAPCEQSHDNKPCELKSHPVVNNTRPCPVNLEGHSTEMQNRDNVVQPIEGNGVKRQKTGTAKEIGNDFQVSSEYSTTIPGDTLFRKGLKGTDGVNLPVKIRQKEKIASNELTDCSSYGTKYSLPVKSPSVPSKDGYCIRPKGTVLERAIQDLERVVTEFRPPTTEIQETDATSPGVKRRLPQEIKQKLAKVARLAQSSQGKISEELLNRLIGILGHLMQPSTLKKHLRVMIEMGLSAKQHKAEKIHQVKQEVAEMIKVHGASESKIAEQQLGSDDFMDHYFPADGSLQSRYNMNEALENKLFELYELYLEGMDEDRGPQSRKLYVELAELWPSGTMDNNGIKAAVNRARERKKGFQIRVK